MRFVGANDHPNPDSPEYYAPRSARSKADPRSNATPQTSSGHLPGDPPSSRFDEMREEAFAKFTRPLESQFVYERRPARGLLATAGAIAVAIGATVILALVLFKAFPSSKSDPSELAVSISTPASATPAQATSDRLPGTASRIQAVSKDTRKRRPGGFRTRRRWNGQRSARKIPGSA